MNKVWNLIDKYSIQNLDYHYQLFSIVLSLIINQLKTKEKISLNKQFHQILDQLDKDQKIKDIIYNEDLSSKKDMIEIIKDEIRKNNSLPEYFIQMISMIQNPAENTYDKFTIHLFLLKKKF